MNATETKQQQLDRLQQAAWDADEELEAWLDRYPPGDDRPQSWHDEKRRLMHEAESAYGSYAEVKYGTQ